jgi:hypothetical protein
MRSLRTPHPDPGVHAAEEWFLEKGVPHFLRHYRTRDRWQSLVVPLVTLIAFEVGMASWHAPTLIQLITAPPLVLAYLVFARTRLTAWPVTGWLQGIRYVISSYALGFVFGILLIAFLYWVGIEPGLNSETVDFVVILLLLLASAALLGPGTRTVPVRTARRLLLCTVAAVVLFAAEGAFFPAFGDLWEELSGWQARWPQSLPSLLIVVPLSLVCFWIGRRARAEQPEPSDGAVMLMPAAPLLLVLLAAETTTVPHTTANPRFAATGTVIVAVLLTATAIWRGRRSVDAANRPLQWKTGQGVYLAVLVAISLLAYPFLVSLYGGIHIRAESDLVTGPEAFGLTAFVLVGYLVVTLLVINFAVDRLALWGFREARRNVRHLSNGLAEGLPLLLVFITFLIFNADTWQVAYAMSKAAYFTLLAILGVAVLFVVFSTAARRAPVNPRYTKSCIEASAEEAAGDDAALLTMIRDWKVRTTPDPKGHEVPLAGKTRLNAIAVLAVYEILVLVPLACLAAGLLFLIAKLTVPLSLAASWIFGDGQEAKGAIWKDDPLPGPWTRIVVVLAVFALLYIAVEIHRNQDQSSRFFAGADEAMSQRLALYLIYAASVAPSAGAEGRPTPPVREGATQDLVAAMSPALADPSGGPMEEPRP